MGRNCALATAVTASSGPLCVTGAQREAWNEDKAGSAIEEIGQYVPVYPWPIRRKNDVREGAALLSQQPLVPDIPRRGVNLTFQHPSVISNDPPTHLV